jgi:hypothetical protein
VSSVQITLVVVIALLIMYTVLITALFFRTFRDTLAHLDNQRIAHHEQLEGLVDRTLARDYREFKEWKAATELPADEATFNLPDDVDLVMERSFDPEALQYMTAEDEMNENR